MIKSLTYILGISIFFGHTASASEREVISPKIQDFTESIDSKSNAIKLLSLSMRLDKILWAKCYHHGLLVKQSYDTTPKDDIDFGNGRIIMYFVTGQISLDASRQALEDSPLALVDESYRETRDACLNENLKSGGELDSCQISCVKEINKFLE